MKKGIRKSISVLILVLGLIFSVSSLLVSNNVKAANYSYKDYQLYDHNSITGKVTPYTIHYRNSSKKLKYFGDDILFVKSEWNYTRYKHIWIYY